MSKSAFGPASRTAHHRSNSRHNENNGNNRKTQSPSARPNGSGRHSIGAAATRPAAITRGTARSTLRSRHPVLVALLPVGLVILAIAGMVVVKAGGDHAASSPLAVAGPSAGTDHGASPLTPQVVRSIMSVTSATFEAVGSPGSVVPPISLGKSGRSLRDAEGRPIITYIGAEYCPYCAAERWALAVALSRFGTFSNLSGTQSSGADVYPNTQTLSFFGSEYTSPYVQFQPVEEASNRQVGGTYQALQRPSAEEQALMARYDSAGSIPFLDIANRYVVTGASYSPQVLQGLNRGQIASQLDDPNSPVAQAIDGTANQITAAICSLTGNKPRGVAQSSTILAIEKALAR